MKKIVSLLMLLICMILTSCTSASIGIIGGADGPTAIYVSKKDENNGKKNEFYERYIDERSLPILDLHIEKNYVSGDRKLILDDSIENPIEYLVYEYYHNSITGDYQKIYEMIAEEGLLNAIKNDEENFKKGSYLKEIYIDDIDMVDKEELYEISISNQNRIVELLNNLKMEKFAVVEVECSIRHNEKSIKEVPQVGDGEITRYYLIGKSNNEYKICQVYWEGFMLD